MPHRVIQSGLICAGDFSQDFYLSRPMTAKMVDGMTDGIPAAWMIAVSESV